MDEAYMRKMQGVNVVMAKELPNQIRDMLIGKGLTLAQAKAVLEQAIQIKSAAPGVRDPKAAERKIL